MQAFEFKTGRTLIGRLPAEGDIIASLTDMAREKGIRAGWISLIGTVRRAVVGYLDHEKGQYVRIPVDEFMEIVSCQGNVSLKDGAPFVHLHIVLSNRQGRTVAGHLFESVVFVGEVWLQEVEGPALERVPDAASGLSLWKMD